MLNQREVCIVIYLLFASAYYDSHIRWQQCVYRLLLGSHGNAVAGTVAMGSISPQGIIKYLDSSIETKLGTRETDMECEGDRADCEHVIYRKLISLYNTGAIFTIMCRADAFRRSWFGISRDHRVTDQEWALASLTPLSRPSIYSRSIFSFFPIKFSSCHQIIKPVPPYDML